MTYKQYILQILDKSYKPVYTCGQIIDFIMEMKNVSRFDMVEKKRRMYGPVSSQLFRMVQSGQLYTLFRYGPRQGNGYRMRRDNL